MSHYDAIVIGAGAVGSAVAYTLQKDGMKVALLERGDICSGTSGACDGNILAVLKQPGPAVDLTLASINLFKEFNDEVEDDFQFHQRGSTLVCEDEMDVNFCKELMKKQHEIKLPVRWLDSKELHEREPYIVEDIIGAIECDVDSSLDPMLVTFALARNARIQGAVVKTNCEVTGILKNKQGEIEGVETVAGKIYSSNVINCGGAFAPFIGRFIGLKIPIIPRKGHILVSETIPLTVRRKVSEAKYAALKYQSEKYTVDPDLEKYGISLVVEPVDEGNCLLGSSREFAGYNTAVSPFVVEAIARRAIRFFPIMKRMNIIRTYAGLRPYTSDHQPIIGPVKSIPGLFIAAGHEGEGIGMSLVTGAIISHYLTGRHVDLPLEKLLPDRFPEICNHC